MKKLINWIKGKKPRASGRIRIEDPIDPIGELVNLEIIRHDMMHSGSTREHDTHSGGTQHDSGSGGYHSHESSSSSYDSGSYDSGSSDCGSCGGD